MIWLLLGVAAFLWFILSVCRAAGRADQTAEQHRRERGQ